MPEYLVFGLDRETGKEVERRVIATDEDHAVKECGIVVESVQPVSSAFIHVHPSSTSRDVAQGSIPGYEGLKLAGMALRLLGAIGLIASVFTIVSALATRSEGFEWSTVSNGLIWSLISVFVIASGEAMLALRDIARNSFHKPA